MKLYMEVYCAEYDDSLEKNETPILMWHIHVKRKNQTPKKAIESNMIAIIMTVFSKDELEDKNEVSVSVWDEDEKKIGDWDVEIDISGAIKDIEEIKGER